MFKLSEKSIYNMKDVDPRLKQVAFRAIEITPIDFGIPDGGGSRTALYQNGLYLNGKSKCDGYIKLSKHQIKPYSDWAKAIDFYAYVDRRSTDDKHCLAVIACAFLQSACELEYNIESGVLWGWDYYHIQLNESLMGEG